MSIEKLHQIVVNLGKATKFGGVCLDIKNVTKDIHMNFWPGNKREIKHTALKRQNNNLRISALFVF